MRVIPLPAFQDNYIWVLQDDKTGVFECVDPGDAIPVLEYAQTKGLELRSILITHHHHDHIGGIFELIKHYPNCIVFGPEDTRIPYITHLVTENDVIHLDQIHFEIISNPGHTSTHISYYEKHRGWLFCGDTLFSAGCGRVFDGTIEQLHESLLKLRQLPPSTQVFCAHEYTLANLKFAHSVEPNNLSIQKQMKLISKHSNGCTLPSTLALERSINPFFRTDTPDIKHYALQHGALNTTSLEVFKILRYQKNNAVF